MYQKHEIIIRKTATPDGKMEIPIQSEAMNFLHFSVEYYADLLRLLSTFEIRDSLSCRAYYKVLDTRISREETDDELRISIDECWDEEFEYSCINPFYDDGLKPGCHMAASFPYMICQLYEKTQNRQFLQKAYAEKRNKLGDTVTYKCLAKYLDTTNGEGAVAVYNHQTDKFDYYGYGFASTGCSGEILKGEIVSGEIFTSAPEKHWHTVSPRCMWFPLDGKQDRDVWQARLQELIEFMRSNNDDNLLGYLNEEEDDGNIYDNIEEDVASDELYMFSMVDGDEYLFDEMECHTAMDVLRTLEKLEEFNKRFIEFQKTTCAESDMDYAKYGETGFCNDLLFFSDDYELVYAEAEKTDENGLLTGELTLHYMKF